MEAHLSTPGDSTRPCAWSDHRVSKHNCAKKTNKKNKLARPARSTGWCETLAGVARGSLPAEVSSESWDKGCCAIQTAGRDGTASNKGPSERRQHQPTIQLALNWTLLFWSELADGHRAAQRNKGGPCSEWVSTDWLTDCIEGIWALPTCTVRQRAI